MRLYHIIAINERNGKHICMTAYPMTHDKCCILLSKITAYKWRRLILKEVNHV